MREDTTYAAPDKGKAAAEGKSMPKPKPLKVSEISVSMCCV